MAGANEIDHEAEKDECCFEWDENSQLYYHASSGFYHDPNAGWYYSTRDGLYYKFENGSYVLLGSNQDAQSEIHQCVDNSLHDSFQDESCGHEHLHQKSDHDLFQGDELEACKTGTVIDEPITAVDEDSSCSHLPNNVPPPSEWLEETLIDLYLSGYTDEALNAASGTRMSAEYDDNGDSLYLMAHDAGNDDDTYELEEGEWIPDGNDGVTDSSATVLDEVVSWDEENWRAQYGQVTQSDEKSLPDIPAVDLWDWAMVTGAKKEGKVEVKRLVGRLVKHSTKLHPSVPSGGGRLKTAPICEVHLDLVRVKSGQVYRLRSPSAVYLASLSTYDSSNPTKDWGFPEMSIDNQTQRLTQFGSDYESKMIGGLKQPSSFQKNRSGEYRDRAAERRALHGGFGVGPGQKKSTTYADCTSPPPVSVSPDEDAAEALNISFGTGSYARRILENMGWKEGEALGNNSTSGLTEPLQAIGNKGNAGLGWDQQGRRKNF